MKRLPLILALLLALLPAFAPAQATQPTSMPSDGKGRVRFTSLLAAANMPKDIGIPQDRFLCIANFKMTAGDFSNTEKWNALDPTRMRECLAATPDGATVCLNFEGSPKFEWGIVQTDAQNEAAMNNVAAMIATVRAVRPKLRADLNAGGFFFDGDGWYSFENGTAPDVVRRLQALDAQFRRILVPKVDSLSYQCYLDRESWPEDLAYDLFGGDKQRRGLHSGWVHRLLQGHTALVTYGKPVRLLFNPLYESNTWTPVYATAIRPDEIARLLPFLRGLGFDAVMLWGEPPSDVVVNGVRQFDPNHPSWRAYVAEQNRK